MTVEFKLPGLGENIEKGDVVNIMVKEGQDIQPNQNVIELETDKAVIEVPCPNGGRVVKIHVQVGDQVPVGGTILTIDETAAETKPPAEKPAEPKPAEEPAAKSKPPERAPAATPEKKAPTKPKPAIAPPTATMKEAEKEQAPAAAGPATRRLARQLGVDLHRVAGTGPGGRILTEDIHQYVKSMLAAGPVSPAGAPELPPLPDFSQWGEVERQPLTGVRRKTAEHMSLAWRIVPHVTQFDLADITELEASRKRYAQIHAEAPGKITITVLAIKAAVATLQAFPHFNSSFDGAGGSLVLKKYYNIGVAVDTEHGLLVPVLRDVNRKSIPELAVELEDLAEKARQRKLGIEQLQGGTFTITNLGGIGGTAFSPIVNYPEVAILGISRGRKEQVVREGEPQLRLMLPLSLSYDHRAIDGADGARFLRKVCEVLSDPFQLLLGS